MTDKKEPRVFVAGHRGMVGSAIIRRLRAGGNASILTVDREDVDLLNASAVNEFFATNRIDQVYLAAAKVGGILANNTYPADFIYQNLMIEANIIHASHVNDVQKVLFLGSSCIYPKHAEQPITEEALLTGPLEPTNEPYAIAKIAGIKLCEGYSRQYGRDYRSAMPTNLYGPGDNFHLDNSHVIPALISRIHQAKKHDAQEVVIWGTGSPRREFLHVDDLADAVVHLMNIARGQYQSETEPMRSHINVGSGIDVTIRELAELLATIIGYRGKLVFDSDKPDGAPRKLMEVSRLKALGWEAAIDLEDGLRGTYDWYVENIGQVRV